MNRFQVLLHNGRQMLISIDQGANAAFGLMIATLCMIPFIPKAGLWWADETISAHCWRWHINGVLSWPRKVVDALALLFGDKDHCQQSYESERLGRQLPPEERTSK